MRSMLIAVLAIVLALTTVMISPADVEAKGKWPKTWEGTQKFFTSKTFWVKDRPVGEVQHHIAALAVKRRPGRGPCWARAKMFQVGLPSGGTWFALRNESRRVKATAVAIVWDMSEVSGKVPFRVRVQSNRNCRWALALGGPRLGEPDLVAVQQD